MKKLVLLFVLFFCSNAFSTINGIAYQTTYSQDTEVEVNTIDNSFTLILLASEEGIKASSTVISGSGDYNHFYLKITPGAKLLNKDDSTLTIASNVTVLMDGGTIHSKNKNLTIDGNLEIHGFSVVSSSGENGANGTYRGDEDEEWCGKDCVHHPACSTDCHLVNLSDCVGFDVTDKDNRGTYRDLPYTHPVTWMRCDQNYCNRSGAAKQGEDAGVLFIKNALIKADVNFSANGGNGGNGIQGWGEKDRDDQEAIRGGNGRDGGNAVRVEIENLIVESGTINLNAIGGNGGKGGKGGNDKGDEDHDGGWGGYGGASGSIIISNLDNALAEINVFSFAGKKGLRGEMGGHSSCPGKHGEDGRINGTVIFSNSTGFVPWKISDAKNISITVRPFEYLDFFPQTEFTALESIQITGCRLRGDAMKGFGSGDPPQVFMSGKTLDFTVFNPLKFYDRVSMNFTEGVTPHKNEECNLASERKEMILPFNGRIKGVDSGRVKDIEIVNIVSGESEFEKDPEERPFSNENFSTEITASLYPNTFYLIKFTVCNSFTSECQNFEFKFFTWKRLW